MDISIVNAIEYDPVSGGLYWKPRPVADFATPRACAIWNARYAGTPALNYVAAHGYRKGAWRGKTAYAHRVAWLIATGQAPETVDHINGDRSDNRLCNLRAASAQENNRNTRQAQGSSGKTGVVARGQKWAAYAYSKRKQIYIGLFDCVEKAAAARDAYVAANYGAFGVLNDGRPA